MPKLLCRYGKNKRLHVARGVDLRKDVVAHNREGHLRKLHAAVVGIHKLQTFTL